MPEIKNQFTGGKMNKDLDERLVPNGEYRDAMNIQVSTSEGSDVGTVQNILGNSLVPGQYFIGENGVCVGSVADEKNDKLYYFIAEEVQELLNDTDLVDNTEWNSSAAITEDYSGEGVLLTSSGGTATTPNYPSFQASNFDLVHGKTYELNVEFSDIDNGSTLVSKFFMLGRDQGNSNYRPYYDDNYHNVQITTSGKYKNIFTFDQSLNNNVPTMSFYVEMVNGATFAKTIRLKSVSLKEGMSRIVEYDSKTNSITPVFVDTQGDVLKFNKDNIITGINIIDDLLFWTDNESEPKKINIQRSIKGTDPSGTVHTNFINSKTDSITPIKEKHITVIKKGPNSPLGLGFLDPLDRDGKTLAGIIETTDGNTSSSFIQNVTQATNPSSFSGITKNDVVRLEIPTDIDGSSNFTLDWEVGDTIVFKEFTGGTAPPTPLSTWVAKGVIQDWNGNNFQDASSSLLKNGYFDYTVGGGLYNVPNWNFNHDILALSEQTNTQVFGWRWEGMEQAMIFNTPDWGNTPPYNPVAWAKLWQSPSNHNFKIGDSYKLTYTLSDVPMGGLYTSPNVKPLLGRVKARISINGDWYDFDYQDTVGVAIEQTIVIDSTSYNGSGGAWYNNHFYFQTDGNQRCRGMIDNVSLEWVEAPNARVEVKINSIDVNPPTPTSIGETTLNYVVDKYIEKGSLFKDKLVRFSYRYKYEDGEYSTFAPFSGVAFSPGNFDYNPKNGYNLGMVNLLQHLELGGFVTSDMGDEVVAIDLLAKIENSPIIYLVDTIQKTDTVPLAASGNAWNLNKYTIKSDTVKGAIPSNQLLRPWDNVPKQALTQEITGNRLVYGNYKQGYNLLNASGFKFTPEFGVNIEEGDIEVTSKRSIKSLRDYQLGVVFLDKYGRETPVISNQTGSFHVNKGQADKSNVIEATFKNQEYPIEARYFKFFMKETAGEYYNVAMGRHYVDDDGSVWLSFPSSDRNKVDEDTFLTLKKGVDSNSLVEEAAKYKVLSIDNEAPDFIKTSKLLVEEKKHNVAADDLFGADLTDAPIEGRDNFKINYLPFKDSSGNDLHEITEGDLYVEFGIDGINKTSNRYRVSKLSSDIGVDSIAASAAVYSFKLKGVLGDDVNFITDDISGNNATKILENATISIYKYIEDAKSSFEGRFFVKIIADDVFNSKIKASAAIGDKKYSILNSQKLYFMNSDFADLNTATAGHSSLITGLDAGAYNTERTANKGMDYINYQAAAEQTAGNNTHHTFTTLTGLTESHRDFSKFAVFFRNYRYAHGDFSLPLTAGGTELVGEYKFGEHKSDNDWKNEFKDYTSEGDAKWTDGWDATGDIGNNIYPTPDETKVADARQIDDEVWFIDNGPFLAHRGSSDNLHWKYIGGVNSPVNGTAAATGKDYYYKTGITTEADKWYMDIGQGGIYQSGITNTSADFFGNDNTHYQDTNTQDIISKHNPGTQFRFKEDPTETVYTIQPSTSYKRVVRYSANYNYANTTLLNEHEVPRLSPNFTNNRRLKIEPKLEWNPASGTLGPIENGYTISVDVVTSSTASDRFANATSNIDDFYIVLDTNIGVDPVYGNIPITPGLIVTNYGSSSLGGASTPYLIVKNVVSSGNTYKVYLCGYSKVLEYVVNGATDTIQPGSGDTIVFRQPQMNGYTENSTNRINTNATGFSIENPGLKAVGYNVEFLTEVPGEQAMPDNPAIFETEPKTQDGGSIYYEASGANAVVLNEKTIDFVLPVGSIITSDLNDPGVTQTGIDSYIPPGTTIASHVDDNTVILSNSVPVEVHDPAQSGAQSFPGVAPGKNYRIIKPNGSSLFVTIESIIETAGSNPASTIEISFKTSLLNQKYYLNWHNCYSFGNGVESNRIKDLFNEQYISNGVKVSTTLDEDFGEEHRKYGLIFSGIYNSNSSTNNLNQFIQAEKITKDVNPIYGSIQKLHSRDSDLIALCEDKCLRILANKDAIYNADGNPQLTANQNVLGQTVPFSGEFGISTNPESFASESYRVYFTDRVRGAVMRLSKDGLTPISDHGMKDWFRDNLKLSNKLIGSYDDKKDEYNITLDNSVNNTPKTVSFKEDVRGWVSFKSFIPENGISCANEYYTFKDGKAWKHHDETVDRNTFYKDAITTGFTASSINVILNESPGTIKTFHTLNYEGTQSKVNTFTDYNTYHPGTNVVDVNIYNNEYYNLEDKPGWKVQHIQTDQEEGSLNEFIEKEGKWFNYIRGKAGSVTDGANITSGFNNADFSFQGIGVLSENATSANTTGCTDPLYTEYDENAVINDGSCSTLIVLGCTDPAANGGLNWVGNGFNPTSDDGSCVYNGCVDSTALNYDPNANTDNGTCLYCVYGCMTVGQFNYDALATCVNVPDSCVPIIYGCISDPNATNYNPLANTSDPLNPCFTTVNGCIDPTACNYDPLANTDDSSCTYCGDITANNEDGGSCNTGCLYCTAVGNFTVDSFTDTTIDLSWTAPSGSNVATWTGYIITYINNTTQVSTTAYPSTTNIDWEITGLDENTSYDISISATCSNSSSPLETISQTTAITDIPGCTDPNAYNYDCKSGSTAPTTGIGCSDGVNTENGSCIYEGCTDALSLNGITQFTHPNPGNFYTNPIDATIDDGTCVTVVNGCTDATALNYDPSANVDDGSCTYPVPGCMDSAEANFSRGANGSGAIIYAATNYNPLATTDDGSCTYVMPQQWTGISTHGKSLLLNTPGWWAGGVWGIPGSPPYYRRLRVIWDVSLAPEITSTILLSYLQGAATSNYPGNINTFNPPSNIWYSDDDGVSWFNNWNGTDPIQLVMMQYSDSGIVAFTGNQSSNAVNYPPHVTSGYTGEQQAARFNFVNSSVHNTYTTPTATTATEGPATYNVMLGCNDSAATNYADVPFYDNTLCTY